LLPYKLSFSICKKFLKWLKQQLLWNIMVWFNE
jgi:hypothetical protein